MGDFIRLLGIMSAAWATGVLVVMFFAGPAHDGVSKPWRYWLASAGVIFEVSGIVSRIELWGDPLSYRDVTFLAANICIIIATMGMLFQHREEVKHD